MNAIVRLIYLVLSVYAWLIVARALLSWIPIRSGGVMYRINRAIYDVTEPYLSLFRRFLPVPRAGNVGIDLSALVGLLVLFAAIQVVTRL